MNKQETFSPPAVGGSSLLVIFAVLCLTVFALLSLSTVQAEMRLADAATDAVTRYYEADLQAEEIFARLRNGEAVYCVTEQDGVYEYRISISQRQMLQVRLQKTDEKWAVLQWQAIALEEEPDDRMDVWKGTEESA